MAVRKNTSERLEKVLARYDLETFPAETKQMLEATMSRDDFDPDKLAEALEREGAKREVAKVDTESKELTEERCPWYVALTRALVLLGIGGFLFAFFCALLRLGFLFFDKITDSNVVGWIDTLQQSHPVIFYSALLVGYLVVLTVFINRFVKSLVGSIEGA